jgi:hypothetical protein
MTTWWRCAGRVCVLFACIAGTAGAQGLPSEPIAIAGGRVTLGGDVTATVGPEDLGFFNYTDYATSMLRMLRIDVSAAVKAGPHFTLLGEIRTENLGQIRPYAAYVRIRPWTSRNFDLQVGRVPPTFGAFARRTYAADNPLIGYPLAYQYMTTMRADALAANTDEMLRKRSLGWLFRYSVGEPQPGGGVALVSAFRWDTGVQVHASNGPINWTASVTTGTVSNPLFRDDNGGPQVAGRIEFRPANGLVAGASWARGPFLARGAREAARRLAGPLTVQDDNAFTQTAWGGDLEYSRDHYVLRFEAVGSAWRLPAVSAPELPQPLSALSTSIEGRYKLRPGLYVASRVDHLGFSDIVGSRETQPWDAPVTRVEIGVGYSLQRNLLLKGSYQTNRRDGGVLEHYENFAAAQLVFWF